MKHSAKRQLLLDTAYKLFNQFGFHATGIDLIIKESGTSKATLYKFFKTKDLLVLEVLKNRHLDNMKKFKTAIEDNLDQSEPVMIMFDIYHEWFQERDFFGCTFVKAGTEFHEQQMAINQFTIQAKFEVKELLIKYLKTGSRNHTEAKEKAHSLMILLDGAIIDAQISQNDDSALKAKEIARLLLKQSA